MTQDEIIEMARQAGFDCYREEITWDDVICTDEIKAYTKLVEEKAAAKEREACAKECWKQMGLIPTQAWTVNPYEQCAEAIRARGQA